MFAVQWAAGRPDKDQLDRIPPIPVDPHLRDMVSDRPAKQITKEIGLDQAWVPEVVGSLCFDIFYQKMHHKSILF